MQALLYRDFDQLELAQLPPPVAAHGEVVVRVAACGICGSELESFGHRSPRRRPPLVMGHEFCGVIESVSAGVAGWQPGDRVVSNSLVSCGRCPCCQRGDNHLCLHRQLFGMHRPGAFAERVAAPACCLLRWPDGLPAEAACLAEPLANGVHMVRLTESISPRSVLVIGAGPIGLLTLQAYQQLGNIRVFVADINPGRLETARQLGAARTIEARSEDVVTAIRALTQSEGVDVVIDAVGSEKTKQQALGAVRPGGAVVWIGLSADEIRLSSFQVTIPEVRIFGTYGARVSDLETAIGLLHRGAIRTESWVQKAPLAEGAALFRRMLAAKDNAIKGVLLP